MRERGGYEVLLTGRPAREIRQISDPTVLNIPLTSRRLSFTKLLVEEGQEVKGGSILAIDPARYSVPLVAPRGGVVRLGAVEGHVTLERLHDTGGTPPETDPELLHAPRNADSAGKKRYKLLKSGAWHHFYEAHTGAIPDPFGSPRAVIVSTMHLEPFVARGDVELRDNLNCFTRGLEHLQTLLEYEPIYLIMPDIKTPFAQQVRDTLRGYAWIKLNAFPQRYSISNYQLVARRLGLRRGDSDKRPVWAVGVSGILAMDRALTSSGYVNSSLISVGGPAAKNPSHVAAMPGYPLDALLEGHRDGDQIRVVNGGALTGSAIPSGQAGLDIECRGLTLLRDEQSREMLGFVRPGFDRRSFSRCFAGMIRPKFAEALNTQLRGEKRPCVACNFCAEVCPAGIYPYLIHKALFADKIDNVEKARPDLCVSCGLCSFVCPSKIELSGEITGARKRLQEELTEQSSKEKE